MIKLAGYSAELTTKHCLRLMSLHGAWLAVGLLGPIFLVSLSLLWPFQLAQHEHALLLVFTVASCWYICFTIIYVINHWLIPQQQQEEELRVLPLPPQQFFLHRLLDTGLIPLLCGLLTVPFLTATLWYIGQPKGVWWDTWYYQLHPLPWPVRAVLCLLVVFNSLLVILLLAYLCQEHLPWISARIATFSLAIAAIGYLSLDWAPQLTKCYSLGSPGIQPAALILPVLVITLILLLLAWLPSALRWRLLVGIAIFGTVALAMWLFLLQHGQLAKWLASLAFIQDMRLTIPYYVGHLNPANNLERLLDPRNTTVLIADHTVGNLIPQQLSTWVGSTALTPLWFLAVVLCLLLGVKREAPFLHKTSESRISRSIRKPGLHEKNIVRILIITIVAIIIITQLNGSAKNINITEIVMQQYGLLVTNDPLCAPENIYRYRFSRTDLSKEEFDNAVKELIRELDKYDSSAGSAKQYIKRTGVKFIYIGKKYIYESIHLGGFNYMNYIYLDASNISAIHHELGGVFFENNQDYFREWPTPKRGYGRGGFNAMENDVDSLTITNEALRSGCFNQYCLASEMEDVSETFMALYSNQYLKKLERITRESNKSAQLDKLYSISHIIEEKIEMVQQAVELASRY